MIEASMKKRIALVHPRMRVGGGSEARPLWIAEALKNDYQVDLITMGEIDLNKMNEAYGTQLKQGEINIISLPIPRPLFHRFDALRGYRLYRYCRKYQYQYDIFISTYNIMNFGRKGIQFIADFSFDDKLRNHHFSDVYGQTSFLYRNSIFRSVYIRFANTLSGHNKKKWKNNITIANSIWSQNILRTAYGIDSTVIYPPVQDFKVQTAQEMKKEYFLVMGRISPEKQIDRAIGILKSVRKKNAAFHLHICGQASNAHYKNYIKSLVQENSSWITLDGLVTGSHKLQLLSSAKYGISCCPYEAFGIATAEMVKSGAIVFVPEGGGQKEIVSHSQLIYRSDDEAVEKIIRVVNNNTLQGSLFKHLKYQSEKFSSYRFIEDVRQCVSHFVANQC